MRYTQIYPDAPLQSYIRYFGVLESDAPYKQTSTFKIIADGCPGLIFQENPDCFADKNNEKLPQLFLHGLTTSHAHKTATGRYRNLCVYFQPHSLKTIFGIDASELTDNYVNLEAILKTDILRQLQDEENTDKWISSISNFISRQIELNKHRDNTKASYAVSKINANDENGLANARSALNLSECSLERMFKRNIGISPKLFFRICRFQAALDFVRRQPQISASLTAIAYQHSYADQAHFIRDFKEFAGVSPRQFLRRANEQAINFPEWQL